MSERNVKVTLTAEVAGYMRAMQDASRATRETGSEADKLTQQRQAFEQLGRSAQIAGAGMLAGLGLAAKAAIDWETAWTGVRKTVDGSDEEMAQLEQQLRELATTLPSTHAEIAAVAEAAGQLGVKREDIVAFTKTMIDLGETTNLSADQAATELTRFANVMGTSHEDASRLGSAIVDLGNNMATTEADIVAMAQRLSGAGVQVGLTEGQVLGLAAALSSVGIEAEAGGSALSKIMIEIASSVETGSDKLYQFAEVSGMTAEEFSQQWRSDPGAALAAFVQGLANAEAQGTSMFQMLEDLEIKEVRMRDALLRSASAADEFSSAMKRGNTAFDENSALLSEAEKRYATAASAVEKMRNSIVEVAISFGETLAPAIEAGADAISDFADFMNDMPEPLKAVNTWIGAIVGTVLLAGGTVIGAVPKIVEFKTALETLGVAGQRTGTILKFAFIGTGILAVVGLAASIIGTVWAAANETATRSLQEHESRVQELKSSLDEVSGSAGAATKEMLAQTVATADNAEKLKKAGVEGKDFVAAVYEGGEAAKKFESALVKQAAALANNDALLERVRGTAKNMGVSYETMMLALSGSQRALDEIYKNPNADEYSYQLEDLRKQMSGVKGELEGTINLYDDEKKALADATAEHERAADAMGKTGKAAKDSGDSAAKAAEEYDLQAEAAARMHTELVRLIDTFSEFNEVNRSAEQANHKYQETLANVQEKIAELKQGLDGASTSLDASTLQGSANRAMLADLAKAAEDAAKASYEQAIALGETDTAVQTYMDSMNASREIIIATAKDMGLETDAAIALADSILAVPDQQQIEFIHNAKVKEAEVAEYERLLATLPAEKQTEIRALVEAGKKSVREIIDEINAIPSVKDVTVRLNYHGGRDPETGLNVPKYNELGGFYRGGIQYFADGGIKVKEARSEH